MDITIYKKLLKERGMTYEDLAQKTGLSLGCIKRIMAGIAQYPRIDTIEAIERALGLDSNNQITATERAAGWSDTAKVSVTPIEFDMLQVFREVGKKYGEESQKAAIAMLENTLGLKK